MTEMQAQRAAAAMAAVANAMRVRMIRIMLEGEVLVGDLADRVGLSQSATSQHLRKLKMAGMLLQRQDRQQRHCTIVPEKVEMLHKLICVAEAQAVQRNRATLRPCPPPTDLCVG